MDAIATAEIPQTVLSMSKQQPNQVPVGSQPYPSAEDVPMDSAQCRLRLNRHRQTLLYLLEGRMPYLSHVVSKTVCHEDVLC